MDHMFWWAVMSLRRQVLLCCRRIIFRHPAQSLAYCQTLQSRSAAHSLLRISQEVDLRGLRRNAEQLVMMRAALDALNENAARAAMRLHLTNSHERPMKRRRRKVS